jgi:hypothetical protein
MKKKKKKRECLMKWETTAHGWIWEEKRKKEWNETN